MIKEEYIFAAKDKDDNFYGEFIISNLQSELNNLEYADVAEGEYQIWKYPTGEQYEIVPDRQVSNEDIYSVPITTKGEVWIPKLNYFVTNQKVVEENYKRLLK